MAQRSKQRQPVYSADTLALRYLGGLMLVALGVMMFLAVEMGMAGNIFDVLRQVCYGLTGGLAMVLPALPIWAGVLVIWSSQRKAPVKPFFYALLAFLALCAFIVLVTRMGREDYLSVLSRNSDGSWGGVIYQGYVQSFQRRASGGALGVVLAYPFWRLIGTILGAVILLLAMIFCLLLAVDLTPGRIRDLATGRITFHWGKRPSDQAVQDQQQIAFQQEQERQRQQAYAQQQAYVLQQQQMAAKQASGGQESAWMTPDGADSHRGWTGLNPVQQNQEEVRDWQQQLTERTAANRSGRKSSLFGTAETGETPRKTGFFGRGADANGTQEGAGRNRKSQIFDGGDVPAGVAGSGLARSGEGFGQRTATDGYGAQAGSQPRQEAMRGSRLFGRKKEAADGLSDLSAEEKRQEGMAYSASSRLRNEKTSKVRTQMEQVEEDLKQWEEPPAQAPEMESRNPRTEQAANRGGEAAPLSQNARGGSWMNQVIAAEQESQEMNRAASTPEKGKEAKAERKGDRAGGEARNGNQEARTPRSPEQIRIPVVQETIKDPTWSPTLKNVPEKEVEPEEEYWEPTPYYAPPITDLKRPDAATMDTSAEDEARSRRLEETLASFRVQARVVHVTHGPAISRFELELAPGTKVGKVSELEKDIAYGMQATSVRIEAPIPGKSLVGVEVPNPKRATVTLREVLESPQMQGAKSILTVALGKDIAGTPVICDLAKMPHMLIAGATGSGKSVCINTIINSLLYRAGPEEVKMILVDPKVVELQCYNGIPHLLLPVVNDPHKAAAALAWAVAEMMERYDRFAERGVRNLEGYNGILGPGEKPMPRIVIIIDELADLMMVCKKDVEEYICRLTQLARAAGIHLIVATQRPSVDVITGLIKANIPSRIAFKTASSVDSRTILDRNGSEQLLGLGDMLYLPTGAFAPTRIQGCFLSDEEVNRIADHVRQANPSSYDPDVLDKLEQLSKGAEETPTMDYVGGSQESGEPDADLFAQAVEYAIADGQISTSTLQRRLKVGYARAGRLTDEMEERGIVSAKDGSKPRKCLITREQWEAMQASVQ